MVYRVLEYFRAHMEDASEPPRAVVRLAVPLRAVGAEVCDAVVATGVTPPGVWR